MTFGIIKQLHQSTKDSLCVIDGKPIKKGDDVILLGDKVKNQRITVWEAAHIAPSCANKVEKWLEEQPKTTTTTTTSSKGYGDLSITEAFRLIGNGNQKRDSRLDELENSYQQTIKAFAAQQAVVVGYKQTIGQLTEQVTKLMDVVRLPESSPSSPPRPPADADNKPVNCLGVSKSTGNACKQTQNRLEDNGYCGQHQGQSGDSERAELDKHSNEVRKAQQEDIPAVSSDIMELLG